MVWGLRIGSVGRDSQESRWMLVHGDPEAVPRTETLLLQAEGRDRLKKEAGHYGLVINSLLRET